MTKAVEISAYTKRLLQSAAWVGIIGALAGMPISAMAQDAGAAGEPVELAPIEVEGVVIDEAGTEGTGSFTTTVTTIGGKTPAPIKEIPQAVSVVTREQIDELDMTQLEDAARRTPGMTIMTNDPGRSSIFTRGFELDTVNIEGLPAPLSSIYGTQQDLAIVDRVEFLRGPSGLFNGAGGVSGLANLGLKKAHDDLAIGGKASVGSWNNYRGEFDLNTPIDEQGKVRARFVGAYQDRESYADVNENSVGVLYGTLGADLSPETKLNLFIWRQDRDATPHNGLPTDSNGDLLDLSRSTFVGADWNHFDNEVFESIVTLEHTFDYDIKASVSARYSERDVSLKYAYGLTAVDPATGTTNLRALGREYSEDVFSTDANLLIPVKFAGQTHEFVVGADFRDYEQTTAQGVQNNIYQYDVYNPTPSAVPEPTLNYTSQTENNPQQFGVYAQGKFRPTDDLTLILGARGAWYEDETRNLINGATTNTEDVDGEFIPFAGIVYDINDEFSVFGSYSEIFQPQSNVSTPITGEQFEFGVKFSMLGDLLNGSVSAFRLIQSDRSVQDPTTLNYYAGGEVQSEGFEASVSGYITPNLDVFAGYAFTDTEYTSDPTIPSGAVYSGITPRHSFNLWTRYTFDEGHGMLDGFHLAGGALAASDTTSGQIEGPGYVVLDAQIGYEINENVSAKLSLNNILDKEYYNRVGGAGTFNFYAPPRNVMLSVAARF